MGIHPVQTGVFFLVGIIHCPLFLALGGDFRVLLCGSTIEYLGKIASLILFRLYLLFVIEAK